ncbi:hypothetical protein [Streptomyces sp. NPDC002769]|uniref:hypothetical protein n=1 Tax=Streptomyces sp. NPDC002769 TaxID=3154542 RepID=UPI003332C439
MTWRLERAPVRAELAEASGPAVLYAPGPVPAAVDATESAGVDSGIGADVAATAGAEVDDRHAGPLTMKGSCVRRRTSAVLRVGPCP